MLLIQCCPIIPCQEPFITPWFISPEISGIASAKWAAKHTDIKIYGEMCVRYTKPGLNTDVNH